MFAPAFNGHCANALSLAKCGGHCADAPSIKMVAVGDPSIFLISQDHLYFFGKQKGFNRWKSAADQQRLSSFIKAAQHNWARLKNKSEHTDPHVTGTAKGVLRMYSNAIIVTCFLVAMGFILTKMHVGIFSRLFSNWTAPAQQYQGVPGSTPRGGMAPETPAQYQALPSTGGTPRGSM